MDDPEWVIPDDVAEDEAAMEVWEAFAGQVVSTYQALRERGVRKEDARFVLPNATATRIIVSMNFRELRHLFRIRISRGAQWEIRQLGIAMLEAVYPHAPAVFGDLREELRERYPDFFAE
jgi:thymidylate synthase (FAD)